MTDEVSADDLTDLYRTGAVKLPSGAAQFSNAAGKAAVSAGSEGEGFHGELGTSPALGPIQTYRRYMQNVLFASTRDRLVDAGEVLCKIAEDFASLDSHNQDVLDTYREELDSGSRVNPDGKPVPIPDEKLPPVVAEAPIDHGQPEKPSDADEIPEVSGHGGTRKPGT